MPRLIGRRKSWYVPHSRNRLLLTSIQPSINLKISESFFVVVVVVVILTCLSFGFYAGGVGAADGGKRWVDHAACLGTSRVNRSILHHGK